MKPTPVSIPSVQQTAQNVRETLKRGDYDRFITGSSLTDAMSKVPHDRFYEDGASLYLQNGLNWTLVIFRRTGNGLDDGEWLNFGTSTGILTWP